MKPEIYYHPECRFHPDNLRLLSESFDLGDYKSTLWLVPPTVSIKPHPSVTCVATTGTNTTHLVGTHFEVINLEQDDILRNITSTAEHTWGLILALTRNIVPASRSVLEDKWSRWEYAGERMLSDMTLGIVGYGRLGTMVGRIANGFRMKWVAYDPYICSVFRDDNWTNRPIERIVDKDIVTFHVPITEETWGMIDYRLLSHFKPGSYLINTSHGDIVDAEALVYYLESGHLAGAALDCVPDELGQSNDYPAGKLINYAKHHDNLLITPHIGGSTKDAWYMTQRRIVEKLIERFCDEGTRTDTGEEGQEKKESMEDSRKNSS